MRHTEKRILPHNTCRFAVHRGTGKVPRTISSILPAMGLWARLAMILLAAASLDSPACAGTEYSFQNGNIQDWKTTPTMSVEAQPSGIHLAATGYDAKLYRSISLEPGRYVLYGRGQGNLKIIVLTDWASQPLCALNLPAQKVGTDYWDFEIPAGSGKDFILAVWIPSKDGKGDLEWLRVEAAPVSASTRLAPSPAELSKERPQPAVVRGFNLPGVGMVPRIGIVGKEVFQEIKNWGANVVRLQINPFNRAQFYKKTFWEAWPAILDDLDNTVANAESVGGLKLIIDLHFPPVPEIMEKRNFDKAELWKHPDIEKDFARAWGDIARKLKPRSNTIWAYDLYNEPLDRSQLPWPPREWYPLAVKILDAIRAADPDVWIMYEPGPGGMTRGYAGLVPLPDKHVIYSVHDYDPTKFTFQGLDEVGGLDKTNFSDGGKGVPYPTTINGGTFDKEAHIKALAPAIEFQKKWQVPMYVGEFSVIRWAPKDDAVQWLKDTISIYESLGWSWTYHAFREYHGWSLEHDENRPPDIHKPAEPVAYETERAKVVKEAFQKNTGNPL